MSGPQRLSSNSTSGPVRREPHVAPPAGERAPTGFSADVRAFNQEGDRQYQIAQAWDPENPRGMTGVEANRAITAAYAWLDGRMSTYLGDPPAANWTTFGKYASREAGGQIQRFEALNGMVNGGGTLKSWLNNGLGLLHDFIGHRESLS